MTCMNEIYPLWIRAHGVFVISPVNRYMASSPLKLMMDRMVCYDGGNPDPTSTHGKRADEAKKLERQGWYYPRHLAGRLFGWSSTAMSKVRRMCAARSATG